MNTKKVAVLMSAYNGEKYVRQQIDSILGQEYKNIEIYVRDDGSTDHTVQVLREYEAKGHIHLKEGKNLGFIGSFLELIKDSREADYYAFADQDDVWLPGKIGYAVDLLGKTEDSKPALYFSNYDYYNEDMEFQEHCKTHKRGPSFRNALVDCISLGFNSVMNKYARNMIIEKMPMKSCGHDWWVYMICTAFGEVIYDKRYTVKYRRLASSVSPGGIGFLKFQIWRFKKFFINDYFKNVKGQLCEFYDFYSGRLSDEDRKTLERFITDGFSMENWLRKVFSFMPYRQGIVDEIMLRAIFFIGKL